GGVIGEVQKSTVSPESVRRFKSCLGARPVNDCAITRPACDSRDFRCSDHNVADDGPVNDVQVFAISPDSLERSESRPRPDAVNRREGACVRSRPCKSRHFTIGNTQAADCAEISDIQIVSVAPYGLGRGESCYYARTVIISMKCGFAGDCGAL